MTYITNVSRSGRVTLCFFNALDFCPPNGEFVHKVYKCTSVQSMDTGTTQTRVGPPSVLRPPPSSLHRRTAMSEIPPEISTGHLLLRGLIPSFVGCAIGDDGSGVGAVRASAFQMTFRKELPQLGRAGGELLPPGSRCVLSRCILMCLCDVWAQLSV
jgi:hypothetical protein